MSDLCCFDTKLCNYSGGVRLCAVRRLARRSLKKWRPRVVAEVARPAWQHVHSTSLSLSLSLRRKLMQVFPPWCLVVSESCCSSSSPSIHAGQCSTGQDSEFRLSPVFGRVDADSSALDTWYATCGPVGWDPPCSDDILRSILLSRTLSGASSQMQPRCSNSFVDLRTGCGLFWNFKSLFPGEVQVTYLSASG